MKYIACKVMIRQSINVIELPNDISVTSIEGNDTYFTLDDIDLPFIIWINILCSNIAAIIDYYIMSTLFIRIKKICLFIST